MLSANSSEAKVFRAHAPPQGPCENLMCALMLLACKRAQTTLVDAIFEGLQEESRLKIMNERNEIHRGGRPRGGIGDLEKNSEVIKMARPEFSK